MNKVEPRFVEQKPRANVRLDDHGREICDPTPMEPPLGYNRTPSLAEQIRSMVHNERLQAELAAAGASLCRS